MKLLHDQASAAQLLEHLRACDAAFVPPLSSRVDLPAYADKLQARARRIEAWDGPLLCGLLAMYADNPALGGFISNVSVLPNQQGRGLAGQMLGEALRLARSLGLSRLRLEVHADNHPALALYRRHGFEAVPSIGDGPTLTLTRELP